MTQSGEEEEEGGPGHRGSCWSRAGEHSLPSLGWSLGGQDGEGVSLGRKGLGWDLLSTGSLRLKSNCKGGMGG